MKCPIRLCFCHSCHSQRDKDKTFLYINQPTSHNNILLKMLHIQSKLCHVQQWFLTWAIRSPRVWHQVSTGTQENDWKLEGHSNFWVSQWKFTAWINYLKFKTESICSLLPCSTEGTVVLYCFTHTLYRSIWFQLHDLIVVKSNCLAANGHSKTCKCSSGPTNTLNMKPIINRIFLLL